MRPFSVDNNPINPLTTLFPRPSLGKYLLQSTKPLKLTPHQPQHPSLKLPPNFKPLHLHARHQHRPRHPSPLSLSLQNRHFNSCLNQPASPTDKIINHSSILAYESLFSCPSGFDVEIDGREEEL